MTLPELTSTISQLTPAAAAKSSMVIPADSVNENTGAIETLKVSIDQILSLNRLLGNEVPTGSPIPWLTDNLPAGYIGEDEAFDPLQYPELGQIYPTNRTPSLKGRTLKCADTGDTAGTHQADQNKAHSHNASFSGNAVGNHTHPNWSGNTGNGGAHRHRQTVNNGTSGSQGNRTGGTTKNQQVLAAEYTEYAPDHDHPITVATPAGGGHTPSGSVTINNDGAAEVRVKSMLCRYMFRAR